MAYRPLPHTGHPQVRSRLRRARGHLDAILGMIEAGRPCVELAQQLHAVERAIGNAKRALIQDHMDHCLEDALAEGQAGAALEECRLLTRFL